MKVYIISGLGADFKVLEKLHFDATLEPVFIPWIVPKNQENFHDFVKRMAHSIDDKEDFINLQKVYSIYKQNSFSIEETIQFLDSNNDYLEKMKINIKKYSK